jgi:hypothetical protein
MQPNARFQKTGGDPAAHFPHADEQDRVVILIIFRTHAAHLPLWFNQQPDYAAAR